MKSKYLHKFFGCKMGLPNGERSRSGELKKPVDLKKWKTSVFLCSNLRLNLSKREEWFDSYRKEKNSRLLEICSEQQVIVVYKRKKENRNF